MITLRIAASKSIKIINYKFSLFWQDCETQEASAWPKVRSADKAGRSWKHLDLFVTFTPIVIN